MRAPARCRELIAWAGSDGIPRRPPGHSEEAGPHDERTLCGVRPSIRDTSGEREFARRRRIHADVQTSIPRPNGMSSPKVATSGMTASEVDSPFVTMRSRRIRCAYMRSRGTMPSVSSPSRSTRPTRRHRRRRARRERSSGACSTGHAAKNELNAVARSKR